jgi:hypothetical protein
MFALAYLKHVFWRPCLIFSSSRAHVGMTTSFLRKGMFNIDGLDISESFLASCFFHPYTCTIVAAWNISFINCSTSTFPINMWDVRLLKHSPPPSCESFNTLCFRSSRCFFSIHLHCHCRWSMQGVAWSNHSSNHRLWYYNWVMRGAGETFGLFDL